MREATCQNCAGQCDVGKPCPIDTEPGELIDTKRAVQGIGGAFGAAALVVTALAALALWLA